MPAEEEIERIVEEREIVATISDEEWELINGSDPSLTGGDSDP